jgi:hypothetical protein
MEDDCRRVSKIGNLTATIWSNEQFYTTVISRAFYLLLGNISALL